MFDKKIFEPVLIRKQEKYSIEIEGNEIRVDFSELKKIIKNLTDKVYSIEQEKWINEKKEFFIKLDDTELMEPQKSIQEYLKLYDISSGPKGCGWYIKRGIAKES
jgi:hypothetical protein